MSGWLLLAQLAVNPVLVLMAIVVIVAGSALFLSVHAPSQVPGSILSVLLAGAGLVAIQ